MTGVGDGRSGGDKRAVGGDQGAGGNRAVSGNSAVSGNRAVTGNRAVITGIGAVTASGIGAAALWDAVREGRSSIRMLEGTEYDELPVHIGGQVRDDTTGLDERTARRLSPVLRWAVAAASEALTQACFTGNNSPRGADVIVGTGSGPLTPIHDAVRAYDERGPRAVPVTLSAYGTPDAAATVIAQHHGLRGEARAISAACASSTVALGQALRSIRHGYADAVLVVGMEDCLTPVNLSAQANLRALARGYEDAPATASRPFDTGRKGFVMAQGAVAILVENADAAAARGATALAEIAGYGATNDAADATAPRGDGEGAAEALLRALRDAGLGRDSLGGDSQTGAGRTEQGNDSAGEAGTGSASSDATGIDLISAHATGTEAGDRAELRALEVALGQQARHTPITALKSAVGHLLGASGAAATLCAVETLRHGILPPTINLDHPEEPGWNYVTTPRAANVHTVLLPAFGFGGHNAALVLRRV